MFEVRCSPKLTVQPYQGILKQWIEPVSQPQQDMPLHSTPNIHTPPELENNGFGEPEKLF